MELNWVLIWVCGVSSAVNLVLSVQQRRSSLWGWQAILTGILLLLAALWMVVPGVAGYIVAPVWFLFALLPGVLMRKVNRMLSAGKYRRASWTAQIAAWLHPSDGWPQQARLVRALALLERGHTERAAAIIDRLGNVETPLGQMARLIQTQQTGDWQSLLDGIERRYPPAVIDREEGLLVARLQALGELGRTTEMLSGMRRVFTGFCHLPGPARAILRMRVAALSGLVQATERQLQPLAEIYGPDVRQYWRTSARQVAGVEGTIEEFRALQSTAGPFLQPMIARRMAQPLPAFDSAAVDLDTAATLAALNAEIDEDATSTTWAGHGRHRPWATWAIALVLVLSFLREMSGGGLTPTFSLQYLSHLINRSLDPNNLIDLGALVVPQSYTPGQWWRVFTAGFLHFGPLHLALNLLGLLALAPRLERAWGAVPMLTCYLTATFASMALAPQVMSLTEGPPLRILVGASGGMMGLLGGLVGFLAIGWIRHRNEQTRKPLMFLLLIVALQTTFDLSTPNVSFACHSLGLATGVLFGLAWTWLSERRARA